MRRVWARAWERVRPGRVWQNYTGRTMNRLYARVWVALGVAAMAVGQSSCGGDDQGRQRDDPILVALDARQNADRRADAVREAFARAVKESDRIGVRTELAPQIWSDQADGKVKAAIVREMLSEKSERSAGEIREELRLNLPHQTSREVVVEVCKAAAERGWKDFTSAIVRAWGREIPGLPEGERVERATLATLWPERTVEATVFDVFLNPPPDTDATRRLKLEETYRISAWAVLSRDDADGTKRVGLLRQTAGASGKPFVAEILACVDELRVVPMTGEELRWARRLRDPKLETNKKWWAEVRVVVSSLSAEQAKGLGLGHLEALRLSSTSKPEWLTMSRSALLDELRGRLSGREVREASDNRPSGVRVKETLSAWESKLVWADVLTVLMVDEAVASESVRRDLFTYVEFDRRDETTEYGGTVDATPTDLPGQRAEMRAVLYQPRPGQRVNDTTFIASDDMISASDRSLAHYHFHAAERNNAAYAGPSLEDMDYATLFGRACLVVTSLGSDELAVDYYQPGGIVIDLGTIVAPGPAAPAGSASSRAPTGSSTAK